MTTCRYPDFLCIGTQKAGTTWLYEMLARHPDVWLPELKELQYFNQLYIPGHASWIPEHRRVTIARQRAETPATDDAAREALREVMSRQEFDDELYGQVFGAAGAAQTVGEFTPEYSLLPVEGIRHILKLNPATKFIFLIRDPIERAWSHMRMLIGQDPLLAEAPAILELCRAEDVLSRCDYCAILERWSGIAGRDKILVAEFDEIARDPRALLATVCGFLGLPDLNLPDIVIEARIHGGPDLTIPAAVYEALKEALCPIYFGAVGELAAPLNAWAARHYGGAGIV